MNKWVKFYLDTNSTWGVVENREQWLEMKKTWVEHSTGRVNNDLKDCPALDPKLQDAHDLPKFGYVIECTGPDTLEAFFERNNMQW